MKEALLEVEIGSAAEVVGSAGRAHERGNSVIPDVEVVGVFDLRPIVERGASAKALARKGVLIIMIIHRKAEPPLFKVAQASDAASASFSFSERGEKERGKDGDDGNDDQQFDQGKGTTRLILHSRSNDNAFMVRLLRDKIVARIPGFYPCT